MLAFYRTIKLTRANNNNIAADAVVGPVNLLLHSLFTQVDISLNGSLITSSTSTILIELCWKHC